METATEIVDFLERSGASLKRVEVDYLRWQLAFLVREKRAL